MSVEPCDTRRILMKSEKSSKYLYSSELFGHSQVVDWGLVMVGGVIASSQNYLKSELVWLLERSPCLQ